MRIICMGELFAIVINNPWHIITEKLNPWTELYMLVSHKQGRKYIFKTAVFAKSVPSKAPSLIIIKEHISKLRITLISLHVTWSCTLGRMDGMQLPSCIMCFFSLFSWDSWETWIGGNRWRKTSKKKNECVKKIGCFLVNHWSHDRIMRWGGFFFFFFFSFLHSGKVERERCFCSY